MNTKDYQLIIEPRGGIKFVDLKELRSYRDLFMFLTWRTIKTRYAQSIIGIGWAVIQPVFTVLTFTIVFGRLAKVSSDGSPYALFSFAALVPWTFFSNALTDAANSLITSAGTISKVYFPRVILPISSAVSKLVDFGISFFLLLLVMVFYEVAPGWQVLVLPLLVFILIITASGFGMWLTAMAIQYRDVRYALSFFIQLFMYASPVVYPTTLIPAQYHLLYALNPLVGVIEGFRAGLLGTRPIPWDLIIVGSISALVILISGGIYFRSKEHIFADVA